MGILDSINDKLSEISERIEDAGMSEKYTEEDAKQVIENMQHDTSPIQLRTKSVQGKSPLDWLDDGEELQFLMHGMDFDIDDNDEGSNCWTYITDKRMMMSVGSITAKSSKYEISYHDIIGVSMQQRLTSQMRIQTAGHSYKISMSGEGSQLVDNAVNYIRKRKEEIENEDAKIDGDSAIDKIDQLNELKEQGAVTQEEFEEKKQELMDEI